MIKFASFVFQKKAYLNMERNVRPQRLVEEVFFVGLGGLVIQPCPDARVEEFISLQNILTDRGKFGTLVNVSYKFFSLY